MDWIVNLFTNTESVAHIALLYAIVIAIGVYLGKIKIGGISLGVTFVLFAGILAGHVGFTGPKEILTFVQDFGLIQRLMAVHRASISTSTILSSTAVQNSSLPLQAR